MAYDHIKRPDCEKAHSFQAYCCDDPDCGGLHLIALRRNDQPITEIVISREIVREFLAMIHDAGLDL